MEHMGYYIGKEYDTFSSSEELLKNLRHTQAIPAIPAMPPHEKLGMEI